MLKRLIALHLIALSAYAQDAPYITGSILGRLGNMLFEVATTCAVAWDHGAEAYFPGFAPIAHYTEGEFQHLFFRCKVFPPSSAVSCEWATPILGYAPISYQPQMKISGYCQSEKYFAHHRDRLLALFAPSFEDLHYLKTKYSWIIDHPRTVSVHLRYYYAEKPDEDTFIQYDRDYFEVAMSLFPDDSLFVVTSDNLAFARENIPAQGRHVIFIENEPFYIDFFLQMLCKNNIMCNSTFSWWSAWLNQNPNKTVVRPKQWLAGFPEMDGPSNWIKVDAQGMQERQKAPKKYVQQSTTGNFPTYLAACQSAADDPLFFTKFRSDPHYGPNVECGFIGESLQYLKTYASPNVVNQLERIRKIDHYGKPDTTDTEIGRFSGTTLRYIVIADQITKYFDLPNQPIIAEIGAGFGGQCYVMRHVTPFSKYIIFDLPAVERLIGKMLNVLKVSNVTLMSPYDPIDEEKIDLLISNYAFSELDRQTQLDYFARVMKKADRGYVIFNKTSNFDCLSLAEFVQLLRTNRMNPQIHPEPIFTYENNVLITWDRL